MAELQAPASGWAGELELGIGRRGATSYAARQFHQGALRVLRPLYLDASGQVCYALVNPGGAYLGDDHYRIDLAVTDGASLLLTTQSATKVYRTPQGPASQQLDVVLGPGAVLESVPDQLIVYREGSYRQRTSVVMDPSASLLLAEVVTPGWSPDGGRFRYQELRMRTEVWVGDAGRRRLFAVDQMRLVPGERDLAGIGLMEGWSHVGQLLLVDRRVDEELLEVVLGLCEQAPTCSGASLVGVEGSDGVRGVAVRSLGRRTEDLVALHLAIANHVRAAWRGQGPVALRKY